MNKLDICLFCILLTLLATGCRKKKILILDETTEPLELYDYYVDKNGHEGIVFHLYESDYSDVAIVISADEAVLSWGPMGSVVFRADSVSSSTLSHEYFSLAVLQKMYQNGIENYPAQNWCCSRNGEDVIPYTGSWRLPSQEEWEKVCADIDRLNTALAGIGGEQISSEVSYWTSTEDFIWKFEDETLSNDNDPANRAVPMTVRKTALTDKDYWLKEMKYHVRAIKYVLYAD